MGTWGRKRCVLCGQDYMGGKMGFHCDPCIEEIRLDLPTARPPIPRVWPPTFDLIMIVVMLLAFVSFLIIGFTISSGSGKSIDRKCPKIPGKYLIKAQNSPSSAIGGVWMS